MGDGFNPLNAEFQVNTTTLGNQLESSITSLADGGYLVTWQSEIGDTSGLGIFGQRYDADGVKVGTEFQVNTTFANDQSNAEVTDLNSGGFVVTWTSALQDGSGHGIYAKIYDATGAVVGSEFLVNSTTNDEQTDQNVTGLSNGNFVVTWTSASQDGDGLGVYAQIFSATGVLVGSEFQVADTTALNQRLSDITELAGGGFVVTWGTFGQDLQDEAIFAQIYDASGVEVGSEFQVNSYELSGQNTPAITGLTDGGFVVTWQSWAQDGSVYGVYGQVHDASGSKVGGELHISTETDAYQFDPSVDNLPDGGFVVVWSSLNQDGSNYGVYGQRYDAAGDNVGGEILINTYTTSIQYRADVTVLSDGSFVVAWESHGQFDGLTREIYAQTFAAELWGTSGVDTLIDFGGAGWLNGQGGADTLNGRGGQDLILGGSGGDTLIGGSAKDDLQGQAGNDILKGGNGNDELDGGNGDDKLLGGNGNDKFIFKLGYDFDKIVGFEDDIDTFKFDEALWGGGLTKQQVINTYASVDGGDIVFDFGADQLRLKGFTDLGELKDDMAFI